MVNNVYKLSNFPRHVTKHFSEHKESRALLGKLSWRSVTYQNAHSLKVQTVPVSRDSSVLCREIFSENARPALKLKFVTSKLYMT